MAVVARMSDGSFIIGLEEENITRLKDGKPFHKNLAEFGGPNLQILLVYGKTQADIMAQLEPGMADDTKIIDTAKRKKN